MEGNEGEKGKRWVKVECGYVWFFFFSSRRRHTRSLCDWSSDVCSSDLPSAFKIVLGFECTRALQNIGRFDL